MSHILYTPNGGPSRSLDIGPGWIDIYIDGLGQCAAEDSHGSPISIEINEDGRVLLFVWKDINYENPTHKIDMSGARESQRDPRL